MPFADWGIISSSNLEDIEQWQYPLKRFDPFRMRPSQVQSTPMQNDTGWYSYISTIRSQRPIGNVIPSTKHCEYELIINGQDYCIPILTINRQNRETQLYNNLFSHSPYRYDFTEDSIVSVINKFPAMIRYDESSCNIPNLARGLCLVIFPTTHYECLLDVPSEDLTGLLSALQESQRLITHQCLGKVAPMITDGQHIETIVFDLFFNIGTSVGGSIKHIHGQLYADLSNTGHSATIEHSIQSINEDDCLSCQIFNKAREEPEGISTQIHKLKIAENAYGGLFASYAPMVNYQLQIIPRNHVKLFTESTSEDMGSLAELLQLAFLGLDYLKAPDHRNIRLTQLPVGYHSSTDFHLRWTVDPFDTYGGFERNGDQKIAKIFPERIVSKLQNKLLQQGIITQSSGRVNSFELTKHIETQEL